jgi:hypothetical protein
MQSPSTLRPVILIVPPATTPEHPVLSLPALAGFLRSHQVEVICHDFNVEAYHALLATEHIDGYVHRIRQNISKVPDYWKKKAAEILVLAGFLKKNLDKAKNILRDRNDFYDPAKRVWALRTIHHGLTMVSLAYFPVKWDWISFDCAYRPDVSKEVLRAAQDPNSTPFTEFFRNRIKKKILPHSPLLIGISICYAAQVIPAFRFLYLLKEMIPDVHCSVGGAVFTRLTEEIGNSNALFQYCDSFVVNEGETALWSLYQALSEKKSLEGVPNLIYKAKGKIRTNLFMSENIRDIPLPDFDGFSNKHYFLPELVLHLETSRGCYWGRCTFCNLPRISIERKHRCIPPQEISDRVMDLCRRYNSRWVTFWDEAVPPDTLRVLSEGFIEKNFSVNWHAEVRFDSLLDKPLLELMARAGCRGLFFGLESANTKILRLMGRGTDAETINRLLTWCKEVGIHTMVSWFVGFPGEGRAEAEETCHFLLKHRQVIGDAWYPGVFGLRKHSLVERYPKRFGVRIKKDPERDLALSFSYEVDSGIGAGQASVLCKDFVDRFQSEGLRKMQRYGPDYLLYQSHTGQVSPAFEPSLDKSYILTHLNSQTGLSLSPMVRRESIIISPKGIEEVSLSFLIQEENGETILKGESDGLDFFIDQIDGTRKLEQIKKLFQKKFGPHADWLSFYLQLIGRKFIDVP